MRHTLYKRLRQLEDASARALNQQEGPDREADTWHFLPSGARVPFPDLTVDLARHHSFARSRISAPRQKVCGDKPAVGQTNDRIQADWIGRNRTSNPGQRRRLGAGVEFENL